MKKVFGQTVRDIKREVNKKVLKVPGIEQKILDATSNEPWGPHGTHLADIALATRNSQEYQIVMSVIWKRINDTGKNWRHVFKALTVLEYLVAHGSERVIDEIREHGYQISTLSDFQYVDSGGRDQGSNVRRKSRNLVALVNNKEGIQEVRQKAHANKEKYGGAYRPSSGGYGDRCDDERYGNRDDDQNGKERDSGYRDEDKYGRGRDSYSRGGDGRDNYRDEYRGREDDDYHYRSRSKSVDIYTDHSFDDDDRHSTQRLERKLSENNIGAPPTYEEAIRVAPGTSLDERDGETSAEALNNSSLSPVPEATSPFKSASQVPDLAGNGQVVASPPKEFSFDEFDPRGAFEAMPPAATSQEFDFFGSLSASDSTNSLSLVSITPDPTHSEADVPANSGVGTDYAPSSTASAVFTQPYENPFGDTPFKATPNESFQPQPQNFAPVIGPDTLPPVAPKMETVHGFDFGDALGGLSYAPSFENGQHSSASPSLLAPELPAAQTSTDTLLAPELSAAQASTISVLAPELPAAEGNTNDILDFLFPRAGPPALMTSQAAQSGATTNVQGAQVSLTPHMGFSSPPVSEAAPVYSQTAQPTITANMQTAQMNFLPQAAPASEAAPVYPQAAQSATPTNVQAGQSNLFPQSGPSFPPAFSQVAPPSVALSMMQAVQVYHLPQPGLTAPSVSQSGPPASQAATFYPQSVQTSAPTSMQTAQTNFLPLSVSSAPSTQEAAPIYSQAIQSAAPPKMQAAQNGTPANMQTTNTNIVPQTLVLDLLAPQPAAKPQPPKKFEPKSTVWADTLSRGLVNLNISGPKINPLSDIGIDFDAINRKEKRNEVKSSTAPVTSTITMGKAMGSGSGLGRAAAGAFAPPPNPMMSSGMGMGAGIGMGMGVGMGMPRGAMGMGGMGMGGYGGGGMSQPPMGMSQPPMGMNMGMNMGMGMGQGTPMQPPAGPGMPPAGYNPMMGMGTGGYGSQQPYGSGYR